jgi:LysM repeat protein
MEEIISKKQPQNIEFSYETVCHEKIISETEYEICIGIPQSKKYIGYITLVQEQPPKFKDAATPNTVPFYPILIIYELNRFRKITNIHTIATVTLSFCEVVSWMDETIFYGSIIDDFFIIEDILYYKGISLRNAIFSEKIEKMVHLISLSKQFEYLAPTEKNTPDTDDDDETPILHIDAPTDAPVDVPPSLKMVLPTMFKTTPDNKIQPSHVPYPIHHIQYRSISQLKPIINVNITRMGQPVNIQPKHNITPPKSVQSTTHRKYNYNTPQYRKRTVFEIAADYQYDVYHLYAYNNHVSPTSPTPTPKNKHVFVDIAFIPNYTTSKMMNSIFRKIKENDNLDYIEESDDEDDFENMDMAKYVYLDKRVNMECQFNHKFKKWMPIRVVDNTVNYGKIVPITNL